MTVNGTNVTSELTISGTASDYTVVYDPPVNFDYDQVVNVTVDATDLNETPNVMETDAYDFTTRPRGTLPPYTVGADPAPGATGVPRDTNITVHVKDDGDGVDDSTIVMKVEGEDVTSNLTISGDKNNYTLTYDPPGDFSYGEVVNVTVNASDLSSPPNSLTDVYSFTIVECKPDLIIKNIDAYHNETYYSPWFNLSNEVDVTVENIGVVSASESIVSLYINSNFTDKKNVPPIEAGNSTTVQFKWTPVGEDCLLPDCNFNFSYTDYNLTAVVDCDSEVNESNETNNILTTVERAYYNGYMADEPLETVTHGKLHGGLLFTTGDGTYGGLYSVGSSRNTTYEITLPADATVKLARLNVYYTWHYEKDSCPAMEVSITNETGTYVVPLDKRYNDIKCQCPGAPWIFPWGNYVFNVTDYIQGSGTYTVTVKRAVFPPNPSFCIAAPGIEVVYEDKTKPLMEYWINEGADVLIGGRRGDGGQLSLEECINNATFEGGEGIALSKVKNATLGVVSPWAGAGWTPGMTNYLFFNDIELGRGVYSGYSEMVDETLNGMSMYIGSTNAQVGVNLSDVTSFLNTSSNWVGQGDDGDNMMPCNAFLMVEYEEKGIFDTGPGDYPSIIGVHNGTITPAHDIFVEQMYTYPCEGTGGHSEYIKIWNATEGWNVSATWTGYAGDWHNISFDEPFTLEADKAYNYTIKTGSYPQIIHATEYNAAGGKITCTEFVDSNGRLYNDWIPAIMLWGDR